MVGLMWGCQENGSDSLLNAGLKQKQKQGSKQRKKKEEFKSGKSGADVQNDQNTPSPVSENSVLLQGES